jgi:hypothetical protein
VRPARENERVDDLTDESRSHIEIDYFCGPNNVGYNYIHPDTLEKKSRIGRSVDGFINEDR